MISKVRVLRYKGFSDFTLRLPQKAVLVGPNSAGKTTLAQALRLVSVALRHAQRRNARSSFTDDTFEEPGRSVFGWALSEIGTRQLSWYKRENLRHEFREESCGLEVTFKSKARLRLVWPVDDEPFVYIDKLPGVLCRSAVDVRKCTPSVAVVPTLGPVEHRENVLSTTHVRESLGTRITSRHFRNQLFGLMTSSPEGFSAFREYALEHTPELNELEISTDFVDGDRTVDLFVTETSGRTSKEVNWLGDGMQVWLPVLYHVWANRNVDTLVLDEPDVYLHPDLQRRLVGIIDTLEPWCGYNARGHLYAAIDPSFETWRIDIGRDIVRIVYR